MSQLLQQCPPTRPTMDRFLTFLHYLPDLAEQLLLHTLAGQSHPTFDVMFAKEVFCRIHDEFRVPTLRHWANLSHTWLWSHI